MNATEPANNPESRLREVPPPRARRKKFLFFLAHDGFRLYVAARTLEREMGADPRISAEAVDSLFRHLIEKAIVAEFVARTPGDDVIDRFNKTNARDWKRTWVPEYSSDYLDANVSELPSTTAMAREGSPKLLELYSRLSHLIHPRLALPYTMVESANVMERGETPRQFGLDRSTRAVANMESLALHLVTLCEREPDVPG